MVRLANDVEYGLVSYVFTRDAAKGMRDICCGLPSQPLYGLGLA